MTEESIQKIYNQLLNWEGKNASLPYPIHKKLTVEGFGYNDIYEWIADNYTLNSTSKILDAGCGVGFGSISLSKYYNCNVLGISLSEQEVNKANEFALKEGVEDHVNFNQQSYDDLPNESFDFIVAIESVKHTLNIDVTIKSLKNALKPGGTLLIVDDFLINSKETPTIRKYASDWELKVLLVENDFISDFSIKKDLTPFVKGKNNFVLHSSIFILNILQPVFKFAKIIRGGLFLERLFNQEVMKYYVLEFKKDSA